MPISHALLIMTFEVLKGHSLNLVYAQETTTTRLHLAAQVSQPLGICHPRQKYPNEKGWPEKGMGAATGLKVSD